MIKCKQNYIVKKFNHLTVIEQVEDFVSPINNRHRPQFLCQCDCKEDNPNTIVVRLDSLKSGHTTSCGCMKLKHTLDLCEAKRQPMKNSEFLELNLKDENHSLFGRCRANNSEDRKVIYLGQYRSKNDAIIARLNAEKIYFDERSWQIELMERFDV